MLQISLKKWTVSIQHLFEMFRGDNIERMFASGLFLQNRQLLQKVLFAGFLPCLEIFLLKVATEIRRSDETLKHGVHIASITQVEQPRQLVQFAFLV